MSKVLIISTSLRGNSNSEYLAHECEKGAIDAGNKVEFLTLKGKNIGYCIGCLACQRTGKCLLGWVDCFEKAELCGLVAGGGIGDSGDAKHHADALRRAYELGKAL